MAEGKRERAETKDDETAASPRTLWLRAAFGAPMALFVTGACLTVCVGDGTFVARLGESIRGIILAPFAALLYGGILVAVDTLLALVKKRARPTGGKAWLSAGVATLAGAAMVAILGYAARSTIGDEAFAGVGLVLLFGSAFSARFMMGKPLEAATAIEPATPASKKKAA